MCVQDRRQGGAGGSSCCGVFVGILAVVGTVISVTVSLVLSVNDVIQLTQLVLSLSASVTSLVAAVHLCRLCQRSNTNSISQHSVLLDLLLLTSVTSVVAVASFDAVAAHHARHQTTLVVSVVVVVQTVLQTGTVAVGLRRQHHRVWSRSRCSWRQTVALLMACNVAMWLMEVIRCAGLTAYSSHAAAVYTQLTYRSIVHVCAPIAVFHRFITVICLLVMWKQAAVQL